MQTARSVHDFVCWSADVEGWRELEDGVLAMPDLQLVKLDRLFLTRMGLPAIQRVQETLGRRVFADAKIAEIPSKLLEIASLHLAYRPWMLNCMVGGAVSSGVWHSSDRDRLDGMKRFADACRAVGTRACGVTVLTSKDPAIVHQEFNGRTSTEQVLTYVDFMLSAGFTDIVCSPCEAEAIRGESRFAELEINTPGIRFAGESAQDQARVDSPAGALAAGSDRLIIGRSLTAGNPAANYNRAITEIGQYLRNGD